MWRTCNETVQLGKNKNLSQKSNVLLEPFLGSNFHFKLLQNNSIGINIVHLSTGGGFTNLFSIKNQYSTAVLQGRQPDIRLCCSVHCMWPQADTTVVITAPQRTGTTRIKIVLYSYQVDMIAVSIKTSSSELQP